MRAYNGGRSKHALVALYVPVRQCLTRGRGGGGGGNTTANVTWNGCDQQMRTARVKRAKTAHAERLLRFRKNYKVDIAKTARLGERNRLVGTCIVLRRLSRVVGRF